MVAVWVENGGIVARGVLLDYASWAESQGIKLSPLTTTKITLSDLKMVAASQGVTFRPADILFIRSGFINALSGLSYEDATIYASTSPPPAIGVESGEEVLKWIWQNKFSAVAGDMLAFETLPFQSTTHWMHEWLLAGWGLPIGELFDLERLTQECKRLNKWSFFYSSVPLKVRYIYLVTNLHANRCRFQAELQALQMELLFYKYKTAFSIAGYSR